MRLALGFVFYGVDWAVLAVERSLLLSLAPVAATDAPAPGGALDEFTPTAPGLPELFYTLPLTPFLFASASVVLGGDPLFEASTPPPGDEDLFVLS